MKDFLKMIISMEKEELYIKKVIYMKANILMERERGKECKFIKTEIFIKETG